MEHRGKNIYATPKCGLSTVDKILMFSTKTSENNFVVVRNPYSRLVSFYINKVIFKALPPDVIDQFNRAFYEKPIKIPSFEHGDTSYSFEEFIKLLCSFDVYKLDRHLIPQSHGSNNLKSFQVLRLENFKEDIKILCDALGVDVNRVLSVNENHFKRNHDIKTPVYDKPAIWFIDNGVPKDWRLFYNEDLKNLVDEKYKDDFFIFNYDKVI